jgi:hypothetical protein
MAALLLATAMALKGLIITLHGSFQLAQNMSTTLISNRKSELQKFIKSKEKHNG